MDLWAALFTLLLSLLTAGLLVLAGALRGRP